MYIHNRLIDGWIEFIRQEGHGGRRLTDDGSFMLMKFAGSPSCIIWLMVCDAETTIEWFLAS